MRSSFAGGNKLAPVDLPDQLERRNLRTRAFSHSQILRTCSSTDQCERALPKCLQSKQHAEQRDPDSESVARYRSEAECCAKSSCRCTAHNTADSPQVPAEHLPIRPYSRARGQHISWNGRRDCKPRVHSKEEDHGGHNDNTSHTDGSHTHASE